MPNVNLGLSEVFNIVLSLFVFFQWFKDRAREAAVKNILVAVRDMVSRTESPTSLDILDALDASLATIGGRPPFINRVKTVLENIWSKFESRKMAPLAEASPIQQKDLRRIATK